jgi:hypothetical protein
MAAAIAPSMSAAGRRINSKAATQTMDAMRSMAHCRAGGCLRRMKDVIRPHALAKASLSLSVTRAILGKTPRMEFSWPSIAMLVVASLMITNS